MCTVQSFCHPTTVLQYSIIVNTELTSSCTLTKTESLVLVRITISIWQRRFLLMNCKSYQEQNLPIYSYTIKSQLHYCFSLTILPPHPIYRLFSRVRQLPSDFFIHFPRKNFGHFFYAICPLSNQQCQSAESQSTHLNQGKSTTGWVLSALSTRLLTARVLDNKTRCVLYASYLMPVSFFDLSQREYI